MKKIDKPFINMDINIIKQFIEADPSALNYIKNILDYRNLRVEQAYYSKLSYMYTHDITGTRKLKELADAGEFEKSWWQERINSLDRKRRDVHNTALTSFYNFLQIGYKNNLDYVYIGPELTPQKVINYEDYPKRAVITDAMFSLLNSIETNVIPAIETNKELKNLSHSMSSFNKNYHVDKSITNDESIEKDGGIEFDFSNFNNLNNTENL